MLSPLPNAASMTIEQWTSLLADLRSAQSHLLALLRVKTAFWKSLPWLLVGLAHGDVEVARRLGRRAIELFDKDPRQEAHHRLTWHWLRPGPLRTALTIFVGGDGLLSDGGSILVKNVARLRFVMVVETTVEAKHARVTAARRSHVIGPVRVSLSNRLVMLEPTSSQVTASD
jgi:hypothetical protein